MAVDLMHAPCLPPNPPLHPLHDSSRVLTLMDKLKVLIADPISPKGVEAMAATGLLDPHVKTGLTEEEVIQIIPEFAAVVVRSQTKITARILEAATQLKAVGRAGVGVDNVDVDAATKRGVIVMNTPGGNTVSTAEHAFSLLMTLARNIAQADASVRQGKWERKKFEGVELYGKSLAILGMGRIGSEIARRAIAFGMRVSAYDPYLSASRARSLQVELVDDIPTILSQADFVTLHMPLTKETHHMLNADSLAKAKKGVRIINCARGGLIDEKALLAAIEAGQVAGAALDVFEQEPPSPEDPLLTCSKMIFTPHLGASTAEAQEGVGIEIAEAIAAALIDGEIRNAVNMPNIDAKTLAIVGPYIDLGERLGRFLSQTAPKRCERLEIRTSGKVNESDTTPVSRAILKGFLEAAGGHEVNQVNAPALAVTLGLDVKETRTSPKGEFTDLIEITAIAGDQTASVAGTFFGTKPRIVMIGGRHVEAKPSGAILILENTDRPGMVGHIGTIMGKHSLNIGSMSLSRIQAGGTALTVLSLDTVPTPEALQELLTDPDILSAKAVQV